MSIAAPHDDVARAAAAYVREHHIDPLTVADIAAHVGYSEYHFTRLFAASLGFTPILYLAAVRFQHAKQLLLESDLPVVDVCHEVGFSSPGTFTRRFTREVGLPPGAVRRLAQELAERHLPAFSLDGPATRGSVTGTATLSPAARELAGESPQIWVGLFPSPLPTGRPVTGTMRYGEGGFTLPVPADAPWLLAAAFPSDADPAEYLVPLAPVVAPAGPPIDGDTHRDLVLDVAPQWAPPLLTALPALFENH